MYPIPNYYLILSMNIIKNHSANYGEIVIKNRVKSIFHLDICKYFEITDRDFIFNYYLCLCITFSKEMIGYRIINYYEYYDVG